MKNILSLLVLLLSLNLAAQQSATFAVSGNCGMCKSRIEKAAKEAGATEASWNVESKQLSITLPANVTLASIQQKVAAVGHDNAGAKASDEVYNKLHGCCKYDRASAYADSKESCCKSGESCKKDEHKSTEGKHKKCSTKENCTKDGKCSKSSKDGKDCCKKS